VTGPVTGPAAGPVTGPVTGTVVRPVGLSRGAASFAIAWLIGGAIAMLTGAGAVLILLAVGLVAGVAAVPAGRLALRRTHIDAVTTTDLAEAGEALTWQVHATAPPGVHVELQVDGEIVADGWLGGGATTFIGNTPRRGVHERVEVRTSASGRLGLVWWRRRDRVELRPLSVAPPIADTPAPIARANADRHEAGRVAAHQGRDEVDGVQQWRDGDELTSIHWPATLRSGEFVVRQRLKDVAEEWTVVAQTSTADPDGEAARARRSLEDGLRAGARVAVRVDDGEPQEMIGPSAVRHWAAAFDPRPRHDDRPAWWRRSIAITSPEPDQSLTVPARWLVAAATAAPLVMTLTPLGYGATEIAPVLAAVAFGALMSQRGPEHHKVIRQIVALLTGVGVAASLIDLGSIADVGGALRFLLPQLLVSLVVVQGFECVDRRAARVALACSAMLTAYAAGIRVDGHLGFWVALAALGLAVASQAVSHADRRREARAGRPGFARPATTVSVARTVLVRAAAVVVSAAAVIGLLAVVPVPEGPAQLTLPSWLESRRPTPGDGSLVAANGSPLLGGATTTNRNGSAPGGGTGGVGGYPGFSPTMDTSLRGALGDTIVLRVRAPYPDFWRGQTFSQFDGRVWTADANTGRKTEGPDHSIAPATGDVRSRATDDFIQTFYAQVDLPNIVFAANRPQRVLLDAPLWARPDGALRADVVLPAGSAYTVVSQRSRATAAGLRADGDVTLFGSPAPYVQLPDSTTQRTRDLAATLATGQANTYDVILSIQAWLAANITYSLDAPVPPEGTDAVDQFLFQSRQGFCEQIATATAIMLRTLGIPARVATGYVPGERDRVAGVWVSRASDAHAWVEVRFPSFGWVAFDPTASVPLAGEAGRTTVGGDLLRALSGGVTSHIGWVLLAVLGGAGALVAFRLGRRWVHHHRRGRWGVLQDRFVAAALQRGAPSTAANRVLAAVFRAPPDTPTPTTTDAADRAITVAEELDRAAFSDGWSDDDATYRRVLATVRELERAR